MKQKIVMRVEMCCDNSRSKALKIAAKTRGVIKMEITGAEKDILVVVGDGVDPAKLTTMLRKHFSRVSLMSVREDKGSNYDEERKKKESRDHQQNNNDDNNNGGFGSTDNNQWPPPHHYHLQPPAVVLCHHDYDPILCSIL